MVHTQEASSLFEGDRGSSRLLNLRDVSCVYLLFRNALADGPSLDL